MTKKYYETIFQFPQFFFYFVHFYYAVVNVEFSMELIFFFMFGNTTEGNKIPAVFILAEIAFSYADFIDKESLLLRWFNVTS